MRYLAGVVVALALGVTACTGGGLRAGEGRLVFDAARVEVAGAGEPFRAVSDDVTLQRGDRVRVRSGDATLRLPDGASLLLRQGSTVRLDTNVSVLSGDALVLPGDDPLTVQALESKVVVPSGAVRVHTGLGVITGVYEGSARLESGGRSLVVPAYRQASITAYGVVPSRPSPLAYDQDDAWDARYLVRAIELDVELSDRSIALTNNLLEGEGRTLGFYRLLLPQLEGEPGFAQCAPALARVPGETLVGTGIALEAREGSFLDRCRSVFGFRDEGATWGLVAVDQGIVEVRSIRQVLADAVGRLPASATFAAAAAPATPASPIDAPSTGSAAVEAPTPAPAEVPAPPPAPPAGDEQPRGGGSVLPLPPGTDPLEPLDPPGLLEPLLDPVTDTVDGLLGGLLG